jgi:tetratricopeptide (TPR) repeat protein
MEVEYPQDARADASAADASVRPRSTASLSRARDWHATGRFNDAAREYEAVLANEPDNPQAVHLYGVLQYQLGAATEGESLLRRSLSLKPDVRTHSDLGAILVDSGRTDEGLAQYRAALSLDPRDVQTLVREGNTFLGLQRHQAALDSFDRALAVSPLVLDALCNRGSALRSLGKHQEAVDTYERALMVAPRSFESWFNRGLVLRDMQRPLDALQSFERAIEIKPGIAAMLSARGQTLVDLGRLGEALTAFNETIAIQPDMVEAIYNSAVALERLGRAEEAIGRCDRVLALEPQHAAALACRGNALQQIKQYDAALASYDLGLASNPDAFEFLCNRGTALRHLRRYDEALASYDAAIARNSRFGEAWTNRSNVLQDLHRYEEALTSLDRAMEISPDNAMNWFNRGNVYYELGRTDAALTAYDRAVALNADYADAHFARGSLYLLQGDFAKGWAEYEWRMKGHSLAQQYRPFVQPLWRGNEPLDGKTILIHAEQGFGDTLQFCRYAPQLAAMGAHVVLEVQPSLRSLMTSLQGPAQVLAKGEPLPAFDYQCPLLSLPFALRTEASNIPQQTPYLHADPQRVRLWAERLGDKRRPRVGLAWSGNPEHRNDHKRSIDFALFAPLFELNVEWISLQKVVREQDEVLLDEAPIRRFDNEVADFADTAALMQSLDLVISVDSAVAHLAGALGRPVWVLLPNPPEWRWMRDRDDSPWYPGARLFRQSEQGNWTTVIEAVRADVGLPGHQA